MKFKINGEERELIFGVRFVSEIDESEKMEREGIEFGVGLMMVQNKLDTGLNILPVFAEIIKHALYKENVTEDEVIDALDEYPPDELETLLEKVEEELKNSSAVRFSKARMEKTTKEANRKKGLAAVKPTKK